MERSRIKWSTFVPFSPCGQFGCRRISGPRSPQTLTACLSTAMGTCTALYSRTTTLYTVLRVFLPCPVSTMAAIPCDVKIRGPDGHGWCGHCEQRIAAGKEFNQSRVWTDKNGSVHAHLACYMKARRCGGPQPKVALPTSAAAIKKAQPHHLPQQAPPSPPGTAGDAASSSPSPSMDAVLQRRVVLVVREEQPAVQDYQAMLREYGYARLPATAESSLLAHKIMQIPRKARGSLISGNTKQLDLSKQSGFECILPEWQGLVRKTAARLGIDSAGMYVVDEKLLVTGPVAGFNQAVHFDCERGPAAATKFSVLLFCSSGHMGTALPVFPTNDDLSFSHDTKAMQQVSHLLHPSQYESRPAMAGDLIFFAESTPHYGMRNFCPQGDRVVLFAILSPSPDSMQDAQQVYPWLFIGYAYGWGSKQYAQSLIDNLEHQPIRKFIQDGNTAAANHAVATLEAHNLYSLYFPPK